MTMKERREALNLTQTEVAKILGCTASNISFYESGAYRPKYPRAKQMAKLYGCTVEEIMEGCETGDGGRRYINAQSKNPGNPAH